MKTYLIDKPIFISLSLLVYISLIMNQSFALTCEFIDQSCLKQLFERSNIAKGKTLNPLTNMYDLEYSILTPKNSATDLTVRKYFYNSKNIYALSTGSFKNSNLQIIIIDKDLPLRAIVDLKSKDTDKVKKIYAGRNEYQKIKDVISDLVLTAPKNTKFNTIGIMFDETPELNRANIADEFDIYVKGSSLLTELEKYGSKDFYSDDLLKLISKAKQLSLYYPKNDLFLRISAHGTVDASSLTDHQHNRRSINAYPKMIGLLLELEENVLLKKFIFELDSCNAGIISKSSNSSTLGKLMTAFSSEFKDTKISGRASPFLVNYSSTAIKRQIWAFNSNNPDQYLQISPVDTLTVFGGYIYADINESGKVSYRASNSKGEKVGNYPTIVFDLIQMRSELTQEAFTMAKDDKSKITKTTLIGKYKVQPLSKLEINFLMILAINKSLHNYEMKNCNELELSKLLKDLESKQAVSKAFEYIM